MSDLHLRLQDNLDVDKIIKITSRFPELLSIINKLVPDADILGVEHHSGINLINEEYPELIRFIHKIYDLEKDLNLCDEHIDNLREENDLLISENEKLKFKLSLEQGIVYPKKKTFKIRKPNIRGGKKNQLYKTKKYTRKSIKNKKNLK